MREHYNFYIQPTEEEEKILDEVSNMKSTEVSPEEQKREWEEEKRRVKEKCFKSGKYNEDIRDMHAVLELMEEDPEFRARFS